MVMFTGAGRHYHFVKYLKLHFRAGGRLPLPDYHDVDHASNLRKTSCCTAGCASGESALFNNHARSAEIRADSAVRVHGLDTSDPDHAAGTLASRVRMKPVANRSGINLTRLERANREIRLLTAQGTMDQQPARPGGPAANTPVDAASPIQHGNTVRAGGIVPWYSLPSVARRAKVSPFARPVVRFRLRQPGRSAIQMHMSRYPNTHPHVLRHALILHVVWLSLLACTVQAGQPDPRAMLQDMTDQVLAEIHRDPQQLEDVGQVRRLAEQYVLPHVDFRAAAQWVLGKYWRSATEQQREQFVTQFRTLLLNTYLRSIANYHENAIRILPLRVPPHNGRAQVDAEVEQSAGPPVHVSFRVHEVNGKWLIYDMSVDGISLVATHRSTFAREISEQGLAGLIARLTRLNSGQPGRAAN
jgi:phospholipid transport system substrate-binding protein